MHELRNHRSTGAAVRGAAAVDSSAQSLIERACRPVLAQRFGSLESLEVRQLLSLMLEYRLDETTPGETTLFDSAVEAEQGFDQPGQLGTATRITPGRVGPGALSFNGSSTSDFDSNVFDFLGGSGSLAFWIKTTQTGGTNAQTSPAVTGIFVNNDNSAMVWGWIDDRGRIGISLPGTNGVVRSTTPINTGTWQHVVLTRDGTSGQMKVYVNGILQSTITGPTGDKKTMFREFGALRVNSGYNYLNGSLDEVRVYNHALDDAEAAAAFDAVVGAPTGPTGLAAGAVGAQGAELTWSSTSDDESGFRIYTSTGGAAFVAAGTTGSDVNRFALKGLLPNTTYTVRVVAFNPSGESAPSNEITITTGTPVTSTDTGTGLTGIYFDEGGVRRPAPFDGINDETSNFKGKIVVHNAEAVDFDWGNGAPDPAIDPNFFSSRWVGTVKPLYTERYTFYTLTDDGGNLYVNDELVIQDRTYHGMGAGDERSTEVLKPGGILLQAGQQYNIRFEQFEGDGGAGARLRWESISQPKQAIPASQLFPSNLPAPTGAATGLSAASNPNNTVTITWTDPAVQNALGYRLERRATGEANFTEIARIGDADTYTDATTFPGKTYAYRIRAFNVAGDGPYSNEAQVTTNPLPTGPGLLGSYHDDRLMTGAVEHMRVDGDRTWTEGTTVTTGVINWPDIDATPTSPLGTGVPGIDDGANISIRWEGTFTPTTTGPHTFFNRSDDDVRLYVNGQLHVAWPNINNFNQGGGAVGAPGTAGPVVTLNAGTAYPILYEYNQGTGGARAQLLFKGPGMAAPAIITQANLNATVVAPVAATNVTATPGVVTANVSWVDNSRSEWQTIVEQSRDGLNWTVANVLRPGATAPTAVSNPNGAPTNTTVQVASLLPSTTYNFRIRQVNTAGEAISTNFATVTTNPQPAANASGADHSGDTNLSDPANLDWVHWGHGGPTIRNASTDQYTAWEAEDLSKIVAITDGGDGANQGPDGRTWRIVTATDTPSANGTTSTASGGAALYADEELAAHDNGGWVTYNVTFAQPGSYRIYARVRHHDIDANNDTGNNNSTRQPQALNIDTGLSRHNNFDDAGNNVANQQFRWVGGNTLVVPAAGTYTFTWGTREGGFMTDRFILHQNTGLSGAQLDAMTTNRIGPISGATNVGPTFTPAAGAAPGATFSWTDGTPNGTVTATDDGIAATTAGNGFFFTVPAITAPRTLKVYVTADGTTGRFTASMSDNSIAPFVAELTDEPGGAAKSAVYTITFAAEQAGQTLRAEFVNLTGGGQAILQAATLQDSAPAAATGVTATAASSSTVNITWNDVAVNEGGYRVERSTDGTNWTTVALLGVNATSTSDLDALAGTSYQYRVVAIGAAGDTPSASANVTTPASTLPAPFRSRDIGFAGNPQPGSASYDAGTGTYTLQGSGSDIWDPEDHGHFIYRPVTGDVTMTARVTAIDNTDVWSKIGIMYRENLSPHSQHVIMATTPANGTRLQGRRNNGSHSFDITTTVGANGPVRGGTNAPIWVRLERVGDTFKGYWSPDGVTWTLHTTQTIDMEDSGYIGLATSSHNNSNMQNATIDNVTVVGGGEVPADINLNGTAGNDNWHVKLNGNMIEVRNNADGSGAPVSTHNLGSNFTLNGGDGDDTVTVDMSGGDFNLGSFTITGANGTDKVRLTNGDGKTLTLGGLPTLNGEFLDLGTADLKVTGTTIAAIDALLASARNGATRWQGPGIGTSSAGTLNALAPIQQGADTLVKFTYNGDANGDGRVNADDYFRIDQGFLAQPQNPTYNQGDFNYDNVVNADDYFLIDQAFLGQGAPLASGEAAAAAASSSTSSTAVVASEETTKKAAKRRSSGDSLFSSKRIEKRARRR